MKLSYNYFSPLNLVVRHTSTLKANQQCKSGQISSKQSIPKHVIPKRTQSASNKRESARLKRKVRRAGVDETVDLLALAGKVQEFDGFDEVNGAGPEIEQRSELEEIFKTRRNSIKDEIKTIFEEDTSKASCMVQTDEVIQVEKQQPSLLNYIHKSRTASRVQVSRDLSSSLSIKKYKKPEKLTKSTRFFLCKENQPGKFNQSLDNAVKEHVLTPTRMKIRIEKRVYYEQVCRTLNLADTCSLFNGKITASPISTLKKNSSSKKPIRVQPNTCKSYTPIRFNFVS